jgi:hypothetical protein
MVAMVARLPAHPSVAIPLWGGAGGVRALVFLVRQSLGSFLRRAFLSKLQFIIGPAFIFKPERSYRARASSLSIQAAPGSNNTHSSSGQCRMTCKPVWVAAAVERGHCSSILMVCSSSGTHLIAHENQPHGRAASSAIAINARQSHSMSAVETVDRLRPQNIGWRVAPRTT